MKAEQLKVGIKVQMATGSTAVVLAVSRGGLEVRVRYLDSPFEPELEGTEGMCSLDDITGHYTSDDFTKTAGQLG